MASEIRDYEKMKEEYQRVKHNVERQSTELEDVNHEQQHLQRRIDRTTRENKELTEEVMFCCAPSTPTRTVYGGQHPQADRLSVPLELH
jgi:cell shape-determining protein MreC